MLRIIIFAFLLLFYEMVNAQTFPIGHRTLSLTDAARSNRSIPTEVYYPATVQGESVPIAGNPGEQFPIVVIGHGFSMPYSAYQNFWEELVPRGYIVALPATESALIPFPSHSDFGKDMAFILEYLYQQHVNASSPFYNKVVQKGAIIGHSMGGGATFLAAANNPNVTTIVTFAPAETNPSAIAVAPSISVPALIFIGSKDNVAGAAGNATPLYNALASGCKTFITITDGSHCQFAESNFTCEFGESTSCLGCSFVSRAAQHATTFTFLNPWLDFFLKRECSKFNIFQNLLTVASGITQVQSCNIISPPIISSFILSNDTLFLSTTPGMIEWYSDGTLIVGAGEFFLVANQPGVYHTVVTDSFGCSAISDSIAILPTGFNNSVSLNVKVYPNPSGNRIFIEGDFDKVVLRDVCGRIRHSLISTAYLSVVEMASQPSGLYFLEVIRLEEKVLVKVIKE